MTGDWIEIRAWGKAMAKERAIDFFIAAGSPGVLEDDSLVQVLPGAAEAKPCLETPLTACIAYLKKEDAARKLPALVKGLEEIRWEFNLSEYRDSDWSVKWRDGIRAVRVFYGGRRVVVRPPWIEVEKKPGDIFIEIDPSMAFGTGHHATTKLCLKALLMILKRGGAKGAGGAGQKMLDVGTGTGILAIAAMKLGAGAATGIDIDPGAVKIARENVRVNNIKASISGAAVERIRKRYDVVTANIFSGVLVRLAGALSGRLALCNGARLVLSGILKGQAPAVTEAYSRHGLKPLKTFSSGQWAALVFARGGEKF